MSRDTGKGKDSIGIVPVSSATARNRHNRFLLDPRREAYWSAYNAGLLDKHRLLLPLDLSCSIGLDRYSRSSNTDAAALQRFAESSPGLLPPNYLKVVRALSHSYDPAAGSFRLGDCGDLHVPCCVVCVCSEKTAAAVSLGESADEGISWGKARGLS